jgi:hypothetical protein
VAAQGHFLVGMDKSDGSDPASTPKCPKKEKQDGDRKVF